MKHYINECLRRKSDGELLDRGFYIDTDTQEITWHEPIPGGVAHTYTLDEVTYEDGVKVSLEDGELLGLVQICENCRYYGDEKLGYCGVGNDQPGPCEPTDTCSQWTAR